MTYTLILKNDKSKNYRLIGQWLVLFNLLGFTILLINNEAVISKNLWLFISLVVTAAYTFFAVAAWISAKPLPDFWHRSIFGYCAIAWLYEGYWGFSLLLMLMLLLDVLAHKKMLVKISDKKITVPSFTSQCIAWNELNNVILKDGVLTIDFKNNRLFQYPVLNSDRDVDETAFNDFCRARLSQVQAG